MEGDVPQAVRAASAAASCTDHWPAVTADPFGGLSPFTAAGGQDSKGRAAENSIVRQDALSLRASDLLTRCGEWPAGTVRYV